MAETALTTPWPLQDPSPHVLTPKGALTAVSGDVLLDAIRWATSLAGDRVVVDLANVTSLDRGGAMALLDAYVATVLRHGTFALLGVTSGSRTVLEQAGVLDVIDVIDAIDLIETAAPCAGRQKESS